MAAKTPSSVYEESMGSLRLLICPFTDIDDGDTWTSKVPGIVDVWTKIATAVSSASSTCLAASVSNFSTGVITFTSGVASQAGTLFVAAKS
jgi:hypothetical protein